MDSLDRSTILALAPVDLLNHRQSRFAGDNQCVPLGAFDIVDQRRIQSVYASLKTLFSPLHAHRDQLESWVGVIESYLAQYSWTDVVREMQGFGHATTTLASNPLASRVVHDIRGGAFLALTFRLELFQLGIRKPADVAAIYYLTRDHLKICRNAITDIDLAERAMDQAQKFHSVKLLQEKWTNATFHSTKTAVRIVARIQYDGEVAESCLEFSALDRVLYNLINNAARFSADGEVRLDIVPVPESNPRDLRFVVANRIKPDHASALHDKFGALVERVFLGGFTTGGSGVGSRIASEFVANAYGVDLPESAVEGGYIGATIQRDIFIAWFHWPMAGV